MKQLIFLSVILLSFHTFAMQTYEHLIPDQTLTTKIVTSNQPLDATYVAPNTMNAGYFYVLNNKVSICSTLLQANSLENYIYTVTYKNFTDEVMMMQKYEGDSAHWNISQSTIHWEYFDKDKILLFNKRYNILQSVTDAAESPYYIVKDADGSMLKIQFWDLDDGTKCVTHGFAETYVNYFGNVNFIVNI